MQTYHEPDAFRRLAFRAMHNGATVEQSRYWTRPGVRWDISGNCTKPVYREIRTSSLPWDARRGGKFIVTRERHDLHVLEYTVRCRRCDNCRRVRAFQWRLRMRSECEQDSRTWFTTLTLNPASHFKAKVATIERLRRGGTDYDQLTGTEQFQETVATIGEEITRYIKRVRKNSGAGLRYVCVVERHKSGLPHFHMLWHERDPARPVRYKHLHGAWRIGFSSHKLLDAQQEKTVAYVAKYLSKSLVSRVRCSVGYGQSSDLQDCVDRRSRVENLTPFKHSRFAAISGAPARETKGGYNGEWLPREGDEGRIATSGSQALAPRHSMARGVHGARRGEGVRGIRTSDPPHSTATSTAPAARDKNRSEL